jgi:hypothetical protein
MNPTLNELEREARATRALIADLESLTQKFDQTLVRAEDERNLHLDKIAAEKAHLATLIDTAACIVQHLGAALPAVAEVDEVCETETTGSVSVTWSGPHDGPHPFEEVVAVIDSPQDDPVGAVLMADSPFDVIAQDHAEELAANEFQSIGEIAAEVTAAVAAIAAEPPATPDTTDEPEMTDEQVERLEEQTAAALAEDVRELETVGGDRPARRFNPFASNPFA